MKQFDLNFTQNTPMGKDQSATTKVWVDENVPYGEIILRKHPNGDGRHVAVFNIHHPEVMVGTWQDICAEFFEMVRSSLQEMNLVSETKWGDLFWKGGYDMKTLKQWQESGLDFDKFVAKDDYVDSAMVDYFMNILPPRSMNYGYLQVGEPYDHMEDPETGKWKATYTTFVKVDDGVWKYVGNCFAGKDKEPETQEG